MIDKDASGKNVELCRKLLKLQEMSDMIFLVREIPLFHSACMRNESYLNQATELEKECDRKMDVIVASMETLIKKYKGDMSLVDTVVYSYANEKSLKKAWYMSKLEEKGLI